MKRQLKAAWEQVLHSGEMERYDRLAVQYLQVLAARYQRRYGRELGW